MRLLVLADIHAHTSDRTLVVEGIEPDNQALVKPPSHVSSTPNASRHSDALVSLREDPPPDIDLMLVAGDLCDRADEGGLRFVWSELAEFASELGCDILGVPGNHDMDSRFHRHNDPKGQLQQLVSRNGTHFVASDQNLRDQFWARGFLLDSLDELLVLRINTAAHHGYRDEHEHGRVSEFLVNGVHDALVEANNKRPGQVALLLCHHHLFPHPSFEVSQGLDYEVARGSEKLLEALGAYTAEWIIVHGHRHHPRVFYGVDQGMVAPVVLSAGSFGADLNGIEAGISNCYHVVDVDAGYLEKGRVRGVVETYVFSRGVGWRPAPSDDSNPVAISHIEGFGERRLESDLADEVVALVNESNPLIRSADLYDQLPFLKFVSARRLRSVVSQLEARGVRAAIDYSRNLIDRVETIPGKGTG
ncbi:MAG: metallophosphoesterase [Actinomycetota bacterium]